MRFGLSASCAVLLALVAGAARAQVASGSIAGVLTDASGAVIPNAGLDVTNEETAQTRTATTSSDGRYSVETLAPGAYRLRVRFEGFKTLEQLVSVETGTVTTVDSVLEPGTVAEVVTVSGMAPVIRRDQYVVGGLVARTQIERLPLNGRNFLELAKLEPGVVNPSRLADNRTFVAPLGAGLQTIPRIGYTRITVDGASITTPGTAGVLLQVSQDVVQEFQMSTVNFDPAISLTSNGAMNIITRAGGNLFRGSGFSLYRDHNLAAYPALRRDPANPDPFFRRQQNGADIGGPLITNRAFFFVSYERNDQTGVMSVQPASLDFAGLGGIFTTPYRGQLMNARVDVVASPRHTFFARYTHDGNSAFANTGPANSLPSAWSRRTIRADQSLAALTSVLTTQLVNDARVSFFSVSSPDGPGAEQDCPGCFGLGAPRIGFTGAEITIGNPRTVTSDSQRWQVTDSLTWQKTRHRIRAGIDWEHATSATSLINQDPVQLTLWSPSQVRLFNPAIPLPSRFTTLEDVLQLPLRSFQTTVGPGVVPQRGFSDTRVQDLLRLYVSDTWHAASRLTVNGGLAWSLEPNALNNDLSKPALLARLLGSDRLDPPAVQYRNLAPTLGFAWTVADDGKTVVRGGAGRYFDPVASSNKVNLDNERASLLPLGTVRLSATGSNGLCGRMLDFRQPTSFTGAQLMALLPCLRADLLRSINPDNRDFSVRAIDSTKSGINLYDPSYSTPYAVHVGLGAQRELPAGLVISADGVWKRFVHTFINGIDYNHWDSIRGPVIPACTAAQQQDVHATCSNGGLFFDTTIGGARYAGLLVRIEKRFSGRAQLLASYALGSFLGSNGTGVASNGMAVGTSEATGGRVFGFNNDDWAENYGPLPTDQRHILNVSGFVELPRQFQLAFDLAAYSRPPFSAYVNGMDFNGDGTVNDLLPGTRINQFGRGLDRDDLERLVLAYNQQYAGHTTKGGQIAPSITLPDRYTFDDNFFTQDVRVSRAFAIGQNKWRLLVFGEVFNVFNTANLALFSGNLLDRTVFGQPSARTTQVFGSGGPRACQLGARFNF